MVLDSDVETTVNKQEVISSLSKAAILMMLDAAFSNGIFLSCKISILELRTDSSSETDHGLISVNQTGSAGVDIPGLTVTCLNGINLLSII